MIETLGENIDRLCTVEIRSKMGRVGRGYIRHLYAAARKKLGDRSLTAIAAEKLLAPSGNGAHVFITAGAGGPPDLPKGEVDGILGAAVLARTLSLALGVKPVLVAEARHRDPLLAATEGAGLPVLPADWMEGRRHGAIFEVLPENEGEARATVARLYERYHPFAVIAIEKPAPNEKGVFHTIDGVAHSEEASFAWLLISEAKHLGITSIGIGDGGNEIGMGLIRDEVKGIALYGERCQCPCQAGIASITPADILVVATISNWGAYGIAAAVGAFGGGPDAFPTSPILRRAFEDCVRAGAFDGSTSLPILFDDGVPIEVHESIVSMMGAMIASIRITPSLQGTSTVPTSG